jgi:hypothetical protein
MYRFDKFTDEARRVLTLAQDEAMRREHNYIGTEHLLLGIVRADNGVAAQLLVGMGVHLSDVSAAVELAIGRGDRPAAAEVGLTPAGKRVIELSIDESRRLGSGYIGAEHLLLGLVRQGDGIAAVALESLGVTLDPLRLEVGRLLGEQTAPRGGPAETAFRAAEIEASPLRRVVGIGLVGDHDDGGNFIELIALEIRDGGCVLHWKASSADRPLGRGGGVELVVNDEIGTQYGTQEISWWSSGYGGRGDILITPAPSEAAATLRLELRQIHGGAVLTGEIRLRD